jgi:Cache 3/Cache 2 fusion domain
VSPVRAEGDAVAGVIYAALDLDGFNRLHLDNLKIGASGYGFLTTGEGLIVAHPDKANIMKLNLKDFDFGRRMLEQKNGVIQYEYGASTSEEMSVQAQQMNSVVAELVTLVNGRRPDSPAKVPGKPPVTKPEASQARGAAPARPSAPAARAVAGEGEGFQGF